MNFVTSDLSDSSYLGANPSLPLSLSKAKQQHVRVWPGRERGWCASAGVGLVSWNGTNRIVTTQPYHHRKQLKPHTPRVAFRGHQKSFRVSMPVVTGRANFDTTRAHTHPLYVQQARAIVRCTPTETHYQQQCAFRCV